jgi:hypothetical protein
MLGNLTLVQQKLSLVIVPTMMDLLIVLKLQGRLYMPGAQGSLKDKSSKQGKCNSIRTPRATVLNR